MTNYSRTALRELKKRYLNILKKCFLANLMAFSFILPLRAETTEPQLTPSVDLQILGEVLRSSTVSIFDLTGIYVEEGETFNYIISEKDLSNGSMGELGTGKKTIIGVTGKAEDTIINANGNSNLFNLGDGDELSLSNLTITNALRAIYNSGMVELNNVTFESNKIPISGHGSLGYGGAICNSGIITFLGTTIFKSNILGGNGSRVGGAIHNEGTIMFEGDVTFMDNHAASIAGGIYNGATITFNDVATFTSNGATGYSSSGGAIQNTGTITFNDVATFTENEVRVAGGRSGTGGAIYNAATITFNGESSFMGNSAYSTGGAIYNSGSNATITFNGDATFTDNTVSYSSGGAIYNHASGYNSNATIIFNGDATFTGNTAGYGAAIYNYTSGYNSNATIIFNGDATFTGNSASSSGGAISNIGSTSTMTFGENSSISFSENYLKSERHDIANSGTLNILGTVASDIYLTSSGGSVGLKAKDTVDKDDNGNLKYTGSYNLTNTTLDISGDGVKEIAIENLTGSNTKLAFDVSFEEAEGDITMVADKLTLSETEHQFAGVELSIDGADLLNKTVEELPVNQNGEFGLTLQYQATVLGGGASFADTQETVLNSSSIFALEVATSGQELSLEANKLKGTALEYLTSKTGKATLQMEDEGSGALYQVKADEELSLITEGKKVILGASAEASTSVIDANGKELFKLGGETAALEIKNISIQNAKEVINNKAGVVSLNNVVIKETAGNNAIVNVSNLNLKDVMIDKGVDNSGVIVGEGVVSLAGLTGNGTLTMNEATLDVMDQFATSNKVVSNNMKLGDTVKEISFGELEIMEGTTLDIDNKHVTAGKVTFGDGSTLGVTLNNLKDHGVLTHEEVVGDEKAKLSLKLTNGIDTELGIYQVFNKDNNLTLLDNNLLDIVDMGDGSYQVRKKADAILEADLGMSKEQVDTVGALLKEDNAAPKRFLMMQEEVLGALQSEDNNTVETAKKALNALGGRSTSLYQSQATAGFTQLHNVISQMLMNTAAPVFGHNGGEEPARASVYIKGLYDRVNSLTGDGFRMRSKGAVLGVQSAVTEDLTVGVGYAGIDTTAKEPLRRTEVKTNTGFISAQYQPNNWWVSGVVTYSRSQYDEEKHILSSTGTANYDVDSVGAQITTGYNIKKGKVILTPEVGVRYLNARQEGYTDSLGTTVEATNSDFVTTMAGFKVGADLGWIRPLAGVMVGYDVITDDVSSVNTLANGATYTIQGKALDRLSTTVVAGFGMDIGDNATLKLEYNGNYRKEYLDHSGMLRLEWKF